MNRAKTVLRYILATINSGAPFAFICFVFFIFLAYVAPPAFVAVGKVLDAPRCIIGMKEYCDRNYNVIENLFGGEEQE
jgi:hypothetical protein